jgi:hypothetical protein
MSHHSFPASWCFFRVTFSGGWVLVHFRRKIDPQIVLSHNWFSSLVKTTSTIAILHTTKSKIPDFQNLLEGFVWHFKSDQSRKIPSVTFFSIGDFPPPQIYRWCVQRSSYFIRFTHFLSFGFNHWQFCKRLLNNPIVPMKPGRRSRRTVPISQKAWFILLLHLSVFHKARSLSFHGIFFWFFWWFAYGQNPGNRMSWSQELRHLQHTYYSIFP